VDGFEKFGYTCLGLIAVLYVIALFAGIIAAMPFGILGLVCMLGIGALFIKVLKERLNNKEDDHYDKNVDK